MLASIILATTASTFPQHPSLSPTGSHIVYSDRGDLWSVPAAGGTPTRLTSHPASELRSAFAPDGSWIAFESDRDGTRNIYSLPVRMHNGALTAAGPVLRITTSDRWEALSDVTPDGDAVLFHSYREPEIYRAPHMYQAPRDGGPVQRLTDAFGRWPRLSGDGTLTFSRGYAPWERPAYRGSGNRDVWAVDQHSGAFTERASTDANEGEAFPLPDGSMVMLTSRDGLNDVWITGADGSAVNRTQFTTGQDATIGHGARDLAAARDGSRAAFVLWDTLHTLDLTDPHAHATPVTLGPGGGDLSTLDRRIERLDNKVSEVAMHPSGDAVAVVARGEVLVRDVQEDHPTRRVTRGHAREGQIAWSPDGTRLYFTSDEGGDEGIWEATVSMTRDDLKPEQPEQPDQTDEDEAEDTADANAESDTPPADPMDDESEEEDAQPDPEDAEADEEDADEDESDAKNESGARWAGSLRFELAPVIDGPAASRPMPSPDGRSLLYQQGNGDLRLRDLATGEDTLLLESWDPAEVRWADDSRHIVYSVSDVDFNTDIWLMDVQAPDEAVNLTRHPDIDRAPRLTADGKMLVFLSDRNRIGDNWDYDVWAIALDPALEDMTDYEFDAYVKDAAKQAGKRKILPIVTFDHPEDEADDPEKAEADTAQADEDDAEVLTFPDADSAWKRTRRVVSLEGAEDDLYLTPGGDAIVFSGTVGEDSGLWTVDHRGKERTKITSGSVANVRGNRTGSTITFVGGSTAKHAPSGGGKTKSWPIDADARIDVASEQRQKFQETARTFGRTFYHPTLKGLDWDAISARYEDLAAQTRTTQAFNRVVDLLLGEVNGSHTGIYGGFEHRGPRAGIGHLGIDTVPVEDGYLVTDVLQDGPADVDEGGLVVGDVVVAIADRPLLQDGTVRDLRAAMEDTANTETLIDVRGEDGAMRTVLLVPMSYGRWTGLARAAEIEARREAVDQASDDRIGYLHIRGMNMPSVHQFEHDLYAAAHGKDGLIIDVRDNGGGYTTDILLASLTAPAHAYTIPRGAKPEDIKPDTYPRDRRLLYAYQRPIVVLCNENSFSNAEIFSHAIKSTGRGTLVGEETFGGVISTGAFKLIDGSRVRQPFRGWYLQDGTDMESRGAIPDIRVERMPADEVDGRDKQLETAVQTLLQQLPDTPPAVHPRPAT
ncbi:MAG: S41 family peptidase [Phycisphaerales bacterium]|jgi:tricorn protease|nr:S41 family peptidase [Phycisphaerales bacterium]